MSPTVAEQSYWKTMLFQIISDGDRGRFSFSVYWSGMKKTWFGKVHVCIKPRLWQIIFYIPVIFWSQVGAVHCSNLSQIASVKLSETEK